MRGGWPEEMRRRVREGNVGLPDPPRRARDSRTDPPLLRAGTAPLQEFVRSLLSALMAFWVVSTALSYFLNIRPVYTLAALGLLSSVQATYYKYELSLNPDFTIPRCRCSKATSDNTGRVLKSKESTTLHIPTSVLGAGLYSALLFLDYTGRGDLASLLAVGGVMSSAYLAHRMVTRIRALCSLCVNVCAVNLWLAWHLLF